jgi:uncharacterized membrane protein YphA (DoxX/SURF4 family)
MNRISDWIVRVSLAFLLLGNSYDNVANYAELQAWMSFYHTADLLLPAVTLVQVPCAVALLLGWKTLYASLVLATVSALSALLFGSDFSWVLTAGFVILALHEFRSPGRNLHWYHSAKRT